MLAAPLAVSAALLAVASVRLDAPFSSSFDGFNTSVWAIGARSVHDDGWLSSRLGAGVPSDDPSANVPYAHHPPLLRVELGVAETVLGEHRWVARLPALLSTLVAVWLCSAWLGAMGFGARSRALGVLVTGSTAMVLVYGLMLNMEAIWLPFAFALLWCWRRGERGEPVGICCGVVAVAGALAAHQGVLLAAGLAAVGLVRAWRGRRRPDPHELAVLIAAALGALLFAGWVLWAAGGMGDLVEIARVRSGGGVGWPQWAGSQLRHTLAVLGVAGTAALVVGPLLVRRRPAAIAPLVVLLGVATAYAVAFRNGAHLHPYWNVALLPTVALGAALAGDRAAELGTGAARALLAIAAMALVLGTSASMRSAGTGTELGRLARLAGSTGTELSTTELVGPWVRYESGFDRVGQVASCEELLRLAGDDPSSPVLTHRRWAPLRGAEWSELVAHPDTVVLGDAALVPAGALVPACR